VAGKLDCSPIEAYYAQVNGFKGACYMGYKSKEEAIAALSPDEKTLASVEVKSTMIII
jgi:viroplasmin and RNaseH domain-containing protein